MKIESGMKIGIKEHGFLEWDTHLCTAFISLDEVLVVELSPCENIAPVAKVIRTVRKTIPETSNDIDIHMYMYMYIILGCR